MISDLSLLYTDEEDALIDAVRDLVEKTSPLNDMPATLESADFGEQLRKRVDTELGLAHALPSWIDDANGIGWASAGAVVEGFGYGIAPVPVLGLYVTAAVCCVLREAGVEIDVSQHQMVLAFDAGGPQPIKVVNGVLHGTIRHAFDVDRASELLIVAASPDGESLWSVAAADANVSPLPMLDRTRAFADVILEGVPARLIASGDLVRRATEAGRAAGAVLIANELVGVTDRALDLGVAYARNRKQFERPIGSFQAIQHRLADAWTAQTNARATARYAIQCLAARDDDLPVGAAVAMVTCANAAVRATESLVQILGGTGFTWEHPAHLLLKRAKVDALAFGGASHHRGRLSVEFGL